MRACVYSWGCYESNVLLEYLEDLNTGAALLPTHPQQRAISRLWVDHVNFSLSLSRLPNPNPNPNPTSTFVNLWLIWAGATYLILFYIGQPQHRPRLLPLSPGTGTGQAIAVCGRTQNRGSSIHLSSYLPCQRATLVSMLRSFASLPLPCLLLLLFFAPHLSPQSRHPIPCVAHRGGETLGFFLHSPRGIHTHARTHAKWWGLVYRYT